MSQQRIFNLWEEARSTKPIHRDTFKSMYLRALQNAQRNSPNEQLSVIRHQTQDFILFESKGKLPDVTSLALPCDEAESLWLCLQFNGQTVFPKGKVIEPDSLCSFKSMDREIRFTLSAEKHWAIFLGVSATSKRQLLSEFPSLRDHFDEPEKDVLPAIPISYSERKALDTFANLGFGPFSTAHHIGHLFLALYSSYLQRLKGHLQRATEEPNIQLYHRAVAYIRDNYLDKSLNRETIANGIHCSLRSLSRAFEGRPLSLNATILTIRLYKARELLIREPGLSVERIALMLNFFDASHFISQYKKHFRLTPRQERKQLDVQKK